MSKWEWKKLGEVCDVIAGQSPQSSAYNSEGIGLEFHQGKKAFGIRVIQPSNVWTKEYSKIAKKGDILMSVRAPVGPVNFTDREICIGRGLAAIRNTGALDENFLFYYFINNESNMTSKAGAVFDSINRSDIQKFIIPIPPLPEQKRIVKFLDEEFSKIETLKTNAETNLKNAKELFETTLEKELNPLSRHSERSEESSADLPSGWEWKKLGEVCEIICGQDYKNVECESGAYPVYGSGGVIGYAREFRCPANCTIVGRKGSINNPMYVEEPFWNIDTAFGLSAKECMESKYLFYFCKCFDFTTLDKSSGRPSLARKDLLEIQIPLPPLSVQKEIVAHLDKLSENVKRLEANYKQIIANCDELKKSILKKTFERES